MKEIKKTWEFLDDFRGTDFTGQWPTVPEMFFISAKRYGERPCFTDFVGEEGKKVTQSYAEVARKVRSLAAWFVQNGIQKGDRIAVSGKNCSEWGLVFLAALAAGAVICPIDYALHDVEAENLLNTAEPKAFFVGEEKFERFKAKDTPYKVYSLGAQFADDYVGRLTANDEALDIHTAKEDDLAAILFTSGTMGRPKGAMLSHRNLVSDAYIAQTRMNIFSTDVFYALLPIHHAYTLQAVFIESLSVGAEIVYGRSMAVSRLMKELREGRITMLLGVPLLFNKLLNGILNGIRKKGPVVNGAIHALMGISYAIKKVFKKNPGKVLFKSVLNQANIASIRIAICGGGPLAPSVFRIYNEMGIDFVQGYGLTETSPIITLNPIDGFKIESVGQYFFPYMEMKILNPDSEGRGEVAVKGPMVFMGYYKMPDETRAMFTEDDFLKTGDIGWLDADGFLMLSGRAKNMIVTAGGKNVYPEEIENAFQLEGDIAQITVRGYVTDSRAKSEEPEALVYASDDLFARLGIDRASQPLAPAVESAVREIVERVNRDLQPYARITRVTMLERPLEVTTTQKVKRENL